MTSKSILSVLLVSAAAGTFVIGSADVAAQNRSQSNLQGTWKGDFGAGPWTFKFAQSGQSWSGSYTYPKYDGWNQLEKLAVSSNAVQFSVAAKTSIEFDLQLDRSGEAITGTVKFGKGVKPGSSPVVLPVELKRISR